MFMSMFKRTFLWAIFSLILLPATVKADSENNPNRPDIVGFGTKRYSMTDGTTGSTIPVVINYDGSIIPARNAEQDIGNPTHTWRSVHAGTIAVAGGIVNVRELLYDIPAGVIDGFRTSGTGFIISTTNLIDQTSTYYEGSFTQSSGVPRNVVIYSSVNALGVTTTTVIGSCTFYGLDSLGRVTSESITFTTATLTIVNSTATATGIGNVPFIYITSFTAQVTSTTQVQTGNPNFILRIGWGNKIGLANDIVTSSDVYKVVGPASQGDITTSVQATVNTDYNTVTFPGPVPDGADDRVVYYTIRRSPSR